MIFLMILGTFNCTLNAQVSEASLVRDIEQLGYTVEKSSDGLFLVVSEEASLYEDKGFKCHVVVTANGRQQVIAIFKGIGIYPDAESQTFTGAALYAVKNNAELVCGSYGTRKLDNGSQLLVLTHLIESTCYSKDSFRQILQCIKAEVGKWDSTLDGFASQKSPSNQTLGSPELIESLKLSTKTR